jgi:hypothetical protein
MFLRILYLIPVLTLPAALAFAAQGKPRPASADLTPEFQKFGLTACQQGDRDDCSLFAITALAEFELAKATTVQQPRLSEEYLIWAAHHASGTKGKGQGEGEGDQAMFYQAVHGLNALGICADKLMPYAAKHDPMRKPSAAAQADARQRGERWKIHWIKRWDLKRRLTDAELRAIKDALAEGHPVACGLRWPKKLSGHELLQVPAADQVEDGHSIVFTGYRDDPKKPGGGVLLFRNSWGAGWGAQGYGVMSFAYAVAYANDAVWLELGPPRSEVPLARYEAESQPVLARARCEANPQAMKGWGVGLWSHGKQLLCDAKDGGFVELGFAVEKAGKHRVRVLATAGPDYGKIRIKLDGKPVGAEADLYCGRVSPAGSLELGVHELTAGQRRIRFTSSGKNPVSTNYVFGIDAIDLLADH